MTDHNLIHSYQGRCSPSTPPSILDCLTRQAREHGDDQYLTAVGPDRRETTVTYREFDALSGNVASWLSLELGIGPGDVVGLMPLNEIHSVVAILGLLRRGCSVLVLNPNEPSGRLRQQAGALGVRTVLRAASVAADVLVGAVPLPDPSTLKPAGPGVTDRGIELSTDALFFGTSGSTAVSKLVAQTHANIAANAEAVRRHHGLRRGDRMLGCLPIHHVNGLHFTIFATLASGAEAVLAHAFDPFSFPELIERFRPRIASVVPSILEALLATWRRPHVPDCFDYFVSAAAPLQALTARAVAGALGARVLQGYGLTETTNFSTTIPADLPRETYRSIAHDADIPSIGTALYGNEVAVLRPGGEAAEPGEVGEICMRGWNVMSRYVGNDEATREAFRHGWFHSQDLGFFVDDATTGRRLFCITGRAKNIAKVRGESVSLEEMDRVLLALPQVQDAACVSLPHQLLGEEVVATVVCPPDLADLDLQTALLAVFAPSVVPGRILRLPAIPRTPTGKVRRCELTELVARPSRFPPPS